MFERNLKRLSYKAIAVIDNYLGWCYKDDAEDAPINSAKYSPSSKGCNCSVCAFTVSPTSSTSSCSTCSHVGSPLVLDSFPETNNRRLLAEIINSMIDRAKKANATPSPLSSNLSSAGDSDIFDYRLPKAEEKEVQRDKVRLTQAEFSPANSKLSSLGNSGLLDFVVPSKPEDEEKEVQPEKVRLTQAALLALAWQEAFNSIPPLTLEETEDTNAPIFIGAKGSLLQSTIVRSKSAPIFISGYEEILPPPKLITSASTGGILAQLKGALPPIAPIKNPFSEDYQPLTENDEEENDDTVELSLTTKSSPKNSAYPHSIFHFDDIESLNLFAMEMDGGLQFNNALR